MAEAQATGRNRNNASSGFIVTDNRDSDEAQDEGSEDSREARRVGGFIVTDAREESQTDATVGVAEPLPRGRRCSICGLTGHTARTCQATDVATRAPRKPSKEAVGTLAPMVVGTMNFCVVTTFGVPCGITELEAKLLIPSMQRTMERMPAAAATKAAVIIDPLVICTVLVMWGKRIINVKQAEAKEKYQTQPFEQARANGAVGTAYGDSQSPVADNQQTDGVQYNSSVTEPNGTYQAPESMRRSFDDRI